MDEWLSEWVCGCLSSWIEGLGVELIDGVWMGLDEWMDGCVDA